MPQGYEVEGPNGERGWWDGKKITVLDGNGLQVAGGGKETEGERVAGFLSYRAADAQRGMRAATEREPSAARPNLLEAGATALNKPGIANAMRSGNRQVVVTNQLDLLDAALTLGTGAAYTREQLEGARGTYFAGLTDKPEAVAEKKRKLISLLEAAKIKAGKAVPPILEQALAEARAEAGGNQGAAPNIYNPRNADGRTPPAGFHSRVTPQQRATALKFKGAKAPSGDKANPYVPSTDDEFEKLPVGAHFINPADGRILRKAR